MNLLSFFSLSFFNLFILTAMSIPNPDQQQLPQASKLPIASGETAAATQFPIESLTPREWALEHARQRKALGDAAYLTLRKAEMNASTREIVRFMVANQAFPVPSASVEPDRLGTADGRQFRVGAGVPGYVTEGLYALFADGEVEFDGDGGEGRGYGADGEVGEGKVVPAEYLVYEIPREQIEREMKEEEDHVRTREQERDRKILAGELSVRDMRVPQAGGKA